jgi:dCTP deaminase
MKIIDESAAVPDNCGSMAGNLSIPPFSFRRLHLPKTAQVKIMLLSGQEIRRRLANQEISIEPFQENRLNPNSYNLALHDELLLYEEVVLDAATPNRYRRVEIPPDGITLQPNMLYLGRTVEYTETRGVVPMLQGRSSVSRLGLFINPGGGVGDAGFCGTWTLEMHCVQPVRIYPNMEIAQIYYLQLDGPCDEYSSDKYQNSRDIQPSLMFRELGGDDKDTQLELNFDALLHKSR